MNPARTPPADKTRTRLLAVDAATGHLTHHRIPDLPTLLSPGDLLILNDAATLPASLTGTANGHPLELRLARRHDDGTWLAVAFGEGTWRTRTEDRAPPPPLAPGDLLRFRGLEARILEVPHPRLVRLAFTSDDAHLFPALYAAARPVQYAYLDRDLAPGDPQTAYASRPWAVEAPSAGLPLTWDLLFALRRRGIALATVTEAAGLSSTGDPALDARFPLPERYDIPARTIDAIDRAKAGGNRVIAIGTSVVRALEASARETGRAVPGPGTATLLLGPGYRRRVVEGLLTGMHDPTATHYALLQAFAPLGLLRRGTDEAGRAGYLAHEFGDVALVLAAKSPEISSDP